MTYSDIDNAAVKYPGQDQFVVHPSDYTTLSGLGNTKAQVLNSCIVYLTNQMGRYVRIFSAPTGDSGPDSYVTQGVVCGW